MVLGDISLIFKLEQSETRVPQVTFADVRFYAYSAIHEDSPADPKPLFTSSIVIGKWEHPIVARKLKGSSQLVPL